MSNTLITPYGAGVMRAHDAAKFLGVAVSTFWRWVKEGRLPKRLMRGQAGPESKHGLRPAGFDRHRSVLQRAPRRLARRNAFFLLLAMEPGQGAGMAPACRSRAVLLGKGTL